MKRITRFLRRARRFVARALRALQDRTLGRWYYSRLPLDPNLVVYTNLWHRAPRGNPLAIYRKQQELAPHLRGVWIIRKQDKALIPDGIEYVTPRTLAYLRITATATYFVDDANPHWSLAPRDGQIYIQTHHGTALKYMGADRHYSGKRPTDATIATMHRRAQRWTYSLTTSPYLTEVWERAYNNGCVQLEVGFPRNDVLVNATDEDRREARAALGLGEHETAVLFMPTWRTRRGPRKSGVDLDYFAASLPEGTRLLVRDHYYHDRRTQRIVPPNVINVSQGWEVESLYLASDALITDYSSAMFDYALLDKPIVLFTDDWLDYRWARGAYFDITADAPGAVVDTNDELVQLFQAGAFDSEHFAERRRSFRDRFATFEDGRAAERVVRIALLGEDIDGHVGSGYAPERPLGWTPHPRVQHPADPSREAYYAPVGEPAPWRSDNAEETQVALVGTSPSPTSLSTPDTPPSVASASPASSGDPVPET